MEPVSPPKRPWTVFAFLTVLGLTGLPWGPVAGADPPTAVHVVVLGSSTAAGVGPSHPDSAWVNRFRAALQAIDPQHQVTNLAVGGYTTWHIREDGTWPPPGRPDPDTDHNVSEALELDPDAIIVNLPSNDVTLGYWLTEQVLNYEAVRTLAAAEGVPVWFTTSQPRNLNEAGRDSLAGMFVTTMALYGYFAIDFWTGIAEPNGEIRDEFDEGDGIHLNDAAHRILFERVMEERIHELYVLGAAPPRATTALTLLPVRPQPASGLVTIEFSLERAMDVTLTLHDVRGRRIDELVRGARPAGRHRSRFDTAGLPAGVYFALLRGQDGSRATRRIAVVH